MDDKETHSEAVPAGAASVLTAGLGRNVTFKPYCQCRFKIDTLFVRLPI